MIKGDFSVFGESEQGYYKKLRAVRDRFFGPMVLWMKEIGIKPDQLSYAGLFSGVLFVAFFQSHPIIATICLIGALFFDSIDGSLARLVNGEVHVSTRGAILDAMVDYLVYFFVYFELLYLGFFNYFWASLHIANYLMMQFFVIAGNYLKVETFPVVRSKFIIYGLVLVWVLTGKNYFDPVIVMMTVYMIVSNLFLFHKIRCSVSY